MTLVVCGLLKGKAVMHTSALVHEGGDICICCAAGKNKGVGMVLLQNTLCSSVLVRDGHVKLHWNGRLGPSVGSSFSVKLLLIIPVVTRS